MHFEAKNVEFLFYILFGFLVLNFILTRFLLHVTDREDFRYLSWYWPLLLMTFFMHAFFQEGVFEIAVTHAAATVPMCFLVSIFFKTYGLKFPWKSYLVYFLGFFPLTYVLYRMHFSFTIVAIPSSLAVSTPLFHAAYLALGKFRVTSTAFQKFFGVFFLVLPIHAFNYAFFRMDEGAQIWGWATSFALYQILATVLPLFIVDEITRNENKRIKALSQHFVEENFQLKNELEALRLRTQTLRSIYTPASDRPPTP